MSNDEYQHQSTWEQSKHFKPHEIRWYVLIDGKKVVYLKDGVKRLPQYDWLEDIGSQNINHYLHYVKLWEMYYKKIVGIDDFEKD